jgi:uncharacterized membrane protein YvlD (DUF360 family)
MDFLPAGSQITLQVIAMCLTALILPGFRVTSLLGPVAAVVALGFINMLYWDSALFHMIPDTFSIRVLSLLGINAVIFFVVIKILPGIEIDQVFSAIAAPVLFSALTILLKRYAPELTFAEMALLAGDALMNLRNYFLHQTESEALLLGTTTWA